MSNYIYAVATEDGNHLHKVVGVSTKNAEEKIIELYRNDLEIDKEFDNYHEFRKFMCEEYGYEFSSVQDIEAF